MQVVNDALVGHDTDGLTRLDVRKGWGDVITVSLHTSEAPTPARREAYAGFRDSVTEALGGQRHRVEIVWSSAG
ncbi:MAG: hypothetical protein ACLPVF_13530 [Acidimicrobiales bacterium]